MRIIIVVGARPNFIKVGPLMPALASAGIDARLAHTGQHYDALMSDVFFADLEIPAPAWFLGVGSGTHAVQTGTAMMKLEDLFMAEMPDAVLVVGDVNSTLAGALAAVKIGVPVVHLEAGLRSRDMSMPEEVNRLVTDQLSAMLLTPVAEAGENLEDEGVDPAHIHFVGNIMAESVLRNLPRIDGRGVAARGDLPEKGYVLATDPPAGEYRPSREAHRHRGSAFGVAAAGALPGAPAYTSAADRAGLGESGSRVRLIDPVGYLDMLSLQRSAAAIATDSGGVQEEACMLGTPCVTMRRNTEREMTMRVGANRLVAADAAAIAAGLDDALESPNGWAVPERWDLLVAERVVAALQGGILPLAGF